MIIIRTGQEVVVYTKQNRVRLLSSLDFDLFAWLSFLGDDVYFGAFAIHELRYIVGYPPGCLTALTVRRALINLR
jgi:hypothetical protein